VIKLIFLFISFFVLSAQEISMIAHIEKKEIHEKEMVRLFLDFEWEGKLQDFKVRVSQKPVIYGLEILGRGSSNKIVKGENGNSVCRYSIIYELNPTRKGLVSVEGISAIATSVASGEDIELSAGKIDVQVNEYIEPFSIFSKTSLVVLAVLLVFMSVVALFVLRSKKKKEELKQLSELETPIEEEILSKINRLMPVEEVHQETIKSFIDLYEKASNSLRFKELELSFDYTRFIDKIEKYKFSGSTPDVYEFDQMKLDFKEILNKNLSLKN